MSMTLKSNQSLVTTDEIVRSYSEFLEALDTPVALSTFLLLKNRQYADVVTRSIDPKDYLSASHFRPDYQAVSGLKKAAFLTTSIDKRQAALNKFKEAEARCRDTNLRFNSLMYGGASLHENPEDLQIFVMLEKAAKLIKKILGSVPSELDFRFGPGVTSVVKKHVTLPKKYASEIDVTPQLFDSLLDILGPLWVRNLKTVNLVRGSHIAFVPKDAKTDRTICIEPHINGYAQLGLGSFLRSRFKSWVNLDTGQEVNRFLASMAQEWRLATVDLASASDTISRALIWYLLPEAWAELLDRCRSHSYNLDGVEAEFEKFSSMGNGFTFELESIIFYALARASGSCEALTASYGDDIICEAACFDNLQKLLEFCGFEVNWNKSFHRSAFYESCGADFFDGQNVRPFLWKENKPSLVFKMANDISRYSRLNYGRDERYRRCHDEIIGRVKSADVRGCLIPEGMGDIGFIVDFDVARPHVRRLPNGWCGFSIKALKYRPFELDHSQEVRGLLSSLDSPSSVKPINFLSIPRGAEAAKSVIRGGGSYQVGRVTTVKQWHGYGPWH